MLTSRGPTVITMGNSQNGSGVSCCCCQCCTCLNLQFLKTESGVVKIAEMVLGFFCQSIAFNYGAQYSSTIGTSYGSFMTTSSWSLFTTMLLLFCYIFSHKSFSLIRQSLLETAFNTIAAFSYISTCSYLGYAVNVFLHPIYVITPYYQVYPAMSAAYMIGSVVGLLYAYDAWKSWNFYKGFR